MGTDVSEGHILLCLHSNCMNAPAVKVSAHNGISSYIVFRLTQLKQNCQGMYNVTLRRVRATIVAVEKQ